MSRLKILTSFNIELDFEIPDFHKRMFAWMLDVVIAVIFYIVASLTVTVDSHWKFLIMLLPIFLYPLVAELTMNGQTVGKKILGIRVMNENGGKATVSQFVIRWLLRISDLMMLLLIIFLIVYGPGILKQEEVLFFFMLIVADILSIIITPKSQRLGDLAAGTILINLRTKAGLQETVFMETADDYVPQFPEVMRLSDRDLNIIKSVYSTVRKKNDYALAERTAEKIEMALKIKNKQHPLVFLETLLKDYNYLSTR